MPDNAQHFLMPPYAACPVGLAPVSFWSCLLTTAPNPSQHPEIPAGKRDFHVQCIDGVVDTDLSVALLLSPSHATTLCLVQMPLAGLQPSVTKQKM